MLDEMYDVNELQQSTDPESGDVTDGSVEYYDFEWGEEVPVDEATVYAGCPRDDEEPYWCSDPCFGQPVPIPDPDPDPDPDPCPCPCPWPDPDPCPWPDPDPCPCPWPDPDPCPCPWPDPDPCPQPEPGPCEACDNEEIPNDGGDYGIIDI